MAKLVLGIGTSHSPVLTIDSSEWQHRAQADFENPRLNLSDGRFVTYDQLLAASGGRYASVATPAEFERKADICQRALDRLAADVASASPDIVIVIGDDQGELFDLNNMPAISLFYGEEIVTYKKYSDEDSPDWMHRMARGYAMDDTYRFPAARDFSVELLGALVDRGIDLGAVAAVPNPEKAGFGHAFGFVIERLFKGRRIPVVPILLNTYFPPNVPTAARCYDIGRALRAAIEESSSQARVAVVASGGLSHFVVDEPLDRGIIEALRKSDGDYLRKIPRGALHAGSSEILNWRMMAGAVEGLPLSWIEYQPIYRTPAGSGIGVAFGAWIPKS